MANELDLFEQIAPEDQQEDENDLPRDKMGDPAESVLFNTDWTVSTVVQQIERGNIDLKPAFQRRAAWDNTRKSRLIESLTIGLPIPNLVLAENKKERGKFIVIDGKQRLISLYDFVSPKSEDKLILGGLSIRPDLNGYSYDALKHDTARAADFNFFENAPIRTVVIRNWPTENFLYVIFDRLNSGSLPLSPQELRRALLPGQTLDYIDSYIEKSRAFRKALGLNHLDRRMRDSELVLRFIAFELNYPRYDGNFKDFLDATVLHFNSKWDAEQAHLDQILKNLDSALQTSQKVFSPNEIFRKWNGNRFERQINRALFDTVTRHFTDPQIEGPAVAARQKIVEKMKALCANDIEFKRSIEQTTKSQSATRIRMETWGRALAGIVGWKFDEASYRVRS